MSRINMSNADIFLMYMEHKVLMARHNQAAMGFHAYRAEMLDILFSINNCN
jgi:hypothetical protein